jgi:hypothetical protein
LVTEDVFHDIIFDELKDVAPLNAFDKLVTVVGNVIGTLVRLVAFINAPYKLVKDGILSH